MLARLVGQTFMLSTNLSGPQTPRPTCRGLGGRGGCSRPADCGLQGAPAAEGLWHGLGLDLGRGLWRSLGHGHGPLGALVVAVLAELFARRPADRRAHRGDVAQQEVEVVAAPVVKDYRDGLGRLGRDVAGVAQRPEILPGAVAVVELLPRHSLQ